MEKPKRKAPKPPVIRQTKTSIYRLAKANPLLVHDNHIRVADKSVQLPEAVVHGRLTLDEIFFRRWQQSLVSKSQQTGNFSMCNNAMVSASTSEFSVVESTQAIPLESKSSLIRVNSMNSFPMRNATIKARNVYDRKPPAISMKNPVLKPLPPPKQKIPIKPFTRNIYTSQEPLVVNKVVSFKKPEGPAQRRTEVRRSISSEHVVKKATVPTKSTASLSTLRSDTSTMSLDTFSKFMKYRNNTCGTSTPLKPLPADTTLSKLQLPLKEWLSGKNKSLSNFQHLKCFGMQQADKDIQCDENVDPNINFPEHSVSTSGLEKQSIENNENIVTGAIDDLHNLIVMGYPLQQCEAWLDYIKQKHEKIVELPQYWECRAAIEQGRGDVTRAIECYQNSIINGANVDQVDESLGQLLSKFSLLNIDNATPKLEQLKEKTSHKNESGNLFRSSIIQFAIKERVVNFNNRVSNTDEETPKQFMATPVRRSTRHSGVFKFTPGKILYDSLHDVDDSIKENLIFKNNAFL